MKIRTLLLKSFLFGAVASSFGSRVKPSALFLKVPLYHEMPAMNFNSQIFGLVGFAGIACYMFYSSYNAVCATLYGPKKKRMTLEDTVLLRLLLSCAERDMTFIRSGTKRPLKVLKVKLDAMSPVYAIEAEYMRQQFAQIVTLYIEDTSARELLESFYIHWRDAVERACARQPLFALAKAIY